MGAGILSILNANALGNFNSTYNTTTVESAATLQVDNSTGAITAPIQETLLLNGQGSINQGALYYLNGGANNDATWAGNITLDSNTAFGVNKFVGNNAVTGVGQGTFTISGVISDNSTGHNVIIGSNTNSGFTTGELIFSAANTYRGTTTINDGILAIQNNWGLGHAPIANAPSNADDEADTATYVNSTLPATGTLELDGVNAPGGSITVSSQLLVLNNPSAGNPLNTSPDAQTAVDNITGKNTWAGNIVLNTNNPSIGVFGQVNVAESSNPSLTVAGTNLITNAIVPQYITGNITGMTASGVSPIVITTPSTAQLVSGESVYVAGAGGNTGANGQLWTISVLSSTTFSLGTLSNGNGTYTSGGQWYLGSISGNSGLTKLGNGQLTLTTANTFVGNTAVQAGVLEAELSNSLSFGINSVSVSNGASLEIADDFQVANNLAPTNHLTFPNALSITGNGWNTGVATLGALYSKDGINTWSGQITLAGTAAIGVDSAALPTGTPYNYDVTSTGIPLDDSLTAAYPPQLGGALTGGSLTKVGAGQLILPNANTYAGNTTHPAPGWISTIENSRALANRTRTPTRISNPRSPWPRALPCTCCRCPPPRSARRSRWPSPTPPVAPST